ncbi:hypothetical protein ACX40Y_00350 [Sphingomonas sp. RS6]
MLNFHPGAGAIVAADSKSAVQAVDDALLSTVRMYASVLETTKGSNLPASQSQRLFASLTASLSQVVSGRAEMVSTLRLLTHIKGQSNFAVEDFGCPDGWVPSNPLTTAETVPA